MPQNHLRPYKHDPPPELSPQHDKWVVAAEVLVLAHLDQRVRGRERRALPLELWRRVYQFAEPARSKDYKRCACGRVLSITGMGNSTFAKHARSCNFDLSPEEDMRLVRERLRHLSVRYRRACELEAADARHAPEAPAALVWRPLLQRPAKQPLRGVHRGRTSGARGSWFEGLPYPRPLRRGRGGPRASAVVKYGVGGPSTSGKCRPGHFWPRCRRRRHRRPGGMAPSAAPPPPASPRTRGRELDEAELAALRDEWAREQLATDGRG